MAAVLRHSTLPWNETLDAVPLSDQLGPRDRLSLLGQFAAHQALLQFAGIADGPFDPSEWAVVQRRRSDARLIRLAARAASDPPPPLTIVQQFARALGVLALDALRQSWARPEAVYCEVERRLRPGGTWLRRAALGEIASPAPDGLRSLETMRDARLRYNDEACIDSIRSAFDRVVVLGETPSPLAPLREVVLGAQSDSEIVERMLAAERPIVIVKDFERFDAEARRIVELYAATGSGILLMPGGNDLPETRFFVVSARLEPRQQLLARMTSRASLESFVASDAFSTFLDDGTLPPETSALDGVREPIRSFLGALALLGRRVPRPLATQFLRQFLFGGTLDDLAAEGVAAVDDEALVFCSDDVREQAMQVVPGASRTSLCRMAAEIAEKNGDVVRAASLHVDAGEPKRAAALLERAAFASDEEIVRAVRPLPRHALSPRLAELFAHALVRGGRYRDARDLAGHLDGDAREILLATIERRMGDYASALARLEAVQRDAGAEILRAELLHLESRYAEAREVLDRCAAESERVAYLRAIVAIDSGESCEVAIQDPYLAARVAFYRSNSIEDALAALAAARTVAERIDAALDHLFALFTAGRWPEARAAALEALTVIDETQGDRAAGGILYLLAYLAADDGQCAHAAHLIERLEQFYATTHDERRLRELDLLRARLEMARGRFAAAARYAESIAAEGGAPQIVEAANLILDEIDAMQGLQTPLRSTGRSGNVELTRRHELLRVGQALMPVPLRGAEGQARVPVLHIAATAPFPYSRNEFGLRWHYATRNRFGHWNELGSGAPLDSDCIVHTDDERLSVEGAACWSPEMRETLAAIVRLRAENHRLQRLVEQEERAIDRDHPVEGIVGESPAMRAVFALIARVARRDVAVCVLGESGTGKELVAQAIHRHSARRQKPFTAVNCAALPETLLESELFGAVRGAFTGADRDRPGLIETTDGGTLFLDETGELPLAAQAKLLRFLQDGEFRRVGETQNRTADVRIVTATNRKLEAAVEAGRFREDLYYRIAGIEIVLPPLRERGGDVLLLARHFLAREREKHRGGASSILPDAEGAIAAYAWPGNVRELQNAIRSAHALAGEAKAIGIEHLPPKLRAAPRPAAASSYHDAVLRFRRELIERSLGEADGNQNQAAAMLNMSRQALAYQIRELGILVHRR